jgi:hypothetical protein
MFCNPFKIKSLLKEEYFTQFLCIFFWYLACVVIFSGLYYFAYDPNSELEPDQRSFVFNVDILYSKEYSSNRSGDNPEHNETVIFYLKKLHNTLSKSERGFKPEDHGTSVTFTVDGDDYSYTANWLKRDFSDKPTALTITVRKRDGTEEERIFPSTHTRRIPKTIDSFQESINDWIKDLEIHNLEYKKPKIWRYTDFLYFSAVTQLTIGYGDIIPNSTYTRSLVIAQGLFSAFFVIVVVGVVSSSCNSRATR